ncbi:Glucosidase ii beta subunit [Operophtera brumata]|uniref:Glucosidase ii beta subunit n=1 Tax=Operophtera brumata TaxID=104452 RepID=A0A0L7KRS0_OPEBR|nr:Glucosidase ii beta subunit [Operophtera brumata]
MGLKKKKNVIILTLCMVVSFILYQLYFFLTITAEANNRNMVIPVHHEQRAIVHLRSEADVHINDHGVIKGVFYMHMPKYRPDINNKFKCLKSEQKIPFECVNDDYCDCEDGSDEPSTSACVNGTFYCDTQHRKKPIALLEVPSSKVNDGICDCCDGSDEWLFEHTVLLSQSNAEHYRYYVSKCPNKCKI